MRLDMMDALHLPVLALGMWNMLHYLNLQGLSSNDFQFVDAASSDTM
jgi:hypothetical protein